MMDREKFAALMGKMAMAYRQEIGKPWLDGMWLGLDDVEYEALETAVKQAMRECKFMPTVADLRARIPKPSFYKVLG